MAQYSFVMSHVQNMIKQDDTMQHCDGTIYYLGGRRKYYSVKVKQCDATFAYYDYKFENCDDKMEYCDITIQYWDDTMELDTMPI